MFRKLRFLLAISALAVTASSAAVQADDTGLLKFVNGTNATMRFYVDGQQSCAADPGSYCNDSTTVGTHTLYSVYEDPNYARETACNAAQVYVPADGFTWTCS